VTDDPTLDRRSRRRPPEARRREAHYKRLDPRVPLLAVSIDGGPVIREQPPQSYLVRRQRAFKRDALDLFATDTAAPQAQPAGRPRENRPRSRRSQGGKSSRGSPDGEPHQPAPQKKKGSWTLRPGGAA
jgi:hypothetical protein